MKEIKITRMILLLSDFPCDSSSRDAARVKNPGGQVVLGGDNVSPLVEIGLTDLPKSGEAAAPPAPPLAASLLISTS